MLESTKEQDGKFIPHRPRLHPGKNLTIGGTRANGTAGMSSEMIFNFLLQVSFTADDDPL